MLKEIEGHRSVRKYSSKSIDKPVLDDILEAAARASNTGNMQLYSMIVTTDLEIRKQLLPCHFNQMMVVQAPVVITFCADINRFSKWCRMRGAEPVYDNFIWFVNALTDATLASGNAALQAEAHGLGVCYLGTTLYTADKIAQILSLPRGVIPVTTLVIGYPEQSTELTDRLPLQAVVHHQKYRDYNDDDIDSLWAQRESSPQTMELIRQNELPNLARIFTDKRYRAQDNILFSKHYFEMIEKQGFFNQ